MTVYHISISFFGIPNIIIVFMNYKRNGDYKFFTKLKPNSDEGFIQVKGLLRTCITQH